MSKSIEIQAEVASIFCQNFRARRLLLGLTQADLAEIMGVHQGYVSCLESGEVRPRLDTLDVIAGALKTTPAKLLTPSRVPRRASAG